MVRALKIPEKDRDVVIHTYDETARIVMTGRSQRYTRVEVTLFAGRSMGAKKALYKARCSKSPGNEDRMGSKHFVFGILSACLVLPPKATMSLARAWQKEQSNGISDASALAQLAQADLIVTDAAAMRAA